MCPSRANHEATPGVVPHCKMAQGDTHWSCCHLGHSVLGGTVRKRRGSEGQQDGFVDAIEELLPREQFGTKLQRASGKVEVLDLRGRGQDSAQQCQLF